MRDRTAYLREIAKLDLPLVDVTIALLFFYRQTQQYEERTTKELVNDLHDEGFPKQKISRLITALRSRRLTTKGKRKDTIQINAKHLDVVEQKYGKYLGPTVPIPTDSIIPNSWVLGTRRYIEKLVSQINLSYDNGLYDGAAVLIRRLMESLIIETYITRTRQNEIQDSNNQFFMLEKLIQFTVHDNSIAWSRNIKKWMPELKLMGDIAAHDRTYITEVTDINDHKTKIRYVISELLEKNGLKK